MLFKYLDGKDLRPKWTLPPECKQRAFCSLQTLSKDYKKSTVGGPKTLSTTQL